MTLRKTEAFTNNDEPNTPCSHFSIKLANTDSTWSQVRAQSWTKGQNQSNYLFEHYLEADEEIRTLDPLLGKEMLYH